jgi:uncharacterized membrane protein YhhN
MMKVLILSLLALAAAVVTIVADHRGRFAWVYAFKPLAMALVIAVALTGRHASGAAYENLILAGLACSLVGDIFLMLRRKRFLTGLLAFLVAHLFYIAAFASRLEGPIHPGPLVPLLIYLAFVLGVLWSRLGRMRIPVIVYMVAITAMAVLAAERSLQPREAGALLALVGSILFVVSDSILAASRFVRPFRWAQVFILGSYFLAQWFIALSA